jgi:D-alanyl-D-alanine carboxypeptidase (penicillin-binding protein 5/6)
MRRLQGGHARAAALAVAAVVLALGTAGPALAGTLGGEQLASTHRTVSLLPGASPLPDVWAATWILADADSGAVLAQKASHVQRAPASTLKMLTALAVMPNTSPTDTYVATKTAADTYGSRVGLRPGKTYTLNELWYAVFLPSANDAAIAVAQANGGVGRTIDQMNTIAGRLQARNTVAKTPNGLDTPGQVSSAYDLALIGRAGMALPEFAKYAGTAKAMFPDRKGKGSHPIYTTNRLLRHGYKGMTGVKTGFTSRAGRTYVGSATRHGRTLIVALMGISEASETAARKLLDWGFANADKVTAIGQLVDPLAAGQNTPALGAAPGQDSTETPGPGPTAARRLASDLTAPAPDGISIAMLWGAGLVALGAGAVSFVARRGRRTHTDAPNEQGQA